MRITKILIPVMMLLVAVGVSMADTSRNKARHYYLQGAIHEAADEQDVAYEYYRKATTVDPTYADALNAYGMGRLTLPDTFATTTEQRRSLEMARPLIDKYPSDPFTVIYYSYVAQMTDTVPEALRVLNRLNELSPGRPNTLSHLVRAYTVTGQPDSALAYMRRIERVQGVSFESTVQKVQLHLMKQDTVGAIDELSRLVAQNPKSVEYNLTKAKVLSMLSMPDSAFVYLKRAESLDEEDGAVKNEIAQYYAAQGDSASYHEYTRRALLADNLSFQVKDGILKNYISELLKNNGDTVAAGRIFDALLKQYPHEPSVLSMAARYAATRGDYEDAVAKISYAIDLDKRNDEYYGSLMMFHYMEDKFDDVVADYTLAASELEAFNPTLARLCAAAASQGKNFPKAIEMYDELIREVSPEMSLTDTTLNRKAARSLEMYDLYSLSEYYQEAGDVYYQTDSLPQAFAAYEIAVSLVPYNLLALNNYAYFLVEKGGARPGDPRFDRALEMSREAVEGGGEKVSTTFLDTYAWILYLADRIEEAETIQTEAVERAVEEGAESSELHDHFGDILLKAGKPDAAHEQWKKALELDPDNKEIKEKLK